MDKLSVKILRYLKEEARPVHINEIVAKFGAESTKAVAYLKDNNYASEGKRVSGIEGTNGNRTLRYRSDLTFSLSPLGKDFLEHKFGNDFDRWLNRFNGIYAIIGGALLSKPLWGLIEWVWGWIKQIISEFF